MKVTVGVPKGFTLGPTLLKGIYEGVLTLRLQHKRVVIVGFADDIRLSIICKTLEEMKMLAIKAIALIKDWMLGLNLQVAYHKTEVLLVSNCKAQRGLLFFGFNVGDHFTASKQVLTTSLLRSQSDVQLNFNSCVDCR